jgi:hypothetical protein
LELGGEEWVEDPVPGFLVHTAAGISHFQCHILAGGSGGPETAGPDGFFTDLGHFRMYRYPA